MIKREPGTVAVTTTDYNQTMETVKETIEEHGYALLRVGSEDIICPLGTTTIMGSAVTITIEGFDRIITTDEIDDILSPDILIV